ncbi:uncharacterized protein L201_000955 [Kwoniella dendrophila CBS 6074]|uniref:Kinase n=1 Tax=Kwoniella dendrophila CBS 6074 TaxID=1295534 RepID=A0AAX4JL16_9TREE
MSSTDIDSDSHSDLDSVIETPLAESIHLSYLLSPSSDLRRNYTFPNLLKSSNRNPTTGGKAWSPWIRRGQYDSVRSQEDISDAEKKEDEWLSGFIHDAKHNQLEMIQAPPSYLLKELDTGGGHERGISVDPTGKMIIKATHDSEIEFYQRVKRGDERSHEISKWVPKYKGCFNRFLTASKTSITPTPVDTMAETYSSHFSDSQVTVILDHGLDDGDNLNICARPTLKRTNTSDFHRNALMLKNEKYGFKLETISEFDIKLGRNMVNPNSADTTQAKMRKMKQKVRESTSYLDSVQLVWADTSIKDSKTGDYTTIRTDKKYGRSLKRSSSDTQRENCDTLDDAFIRLFPSPIDKIIPKGHAIKNHYSTNHKGYQSKRDDLDQIESTVSTMKDIRQQLIELKESVSRTNMKFTGSSIYVVHGELDNSSPFVRSPYHSEKDNSENKSKKRSHTKVRLIDFARAYDDTGPDQDVIEGIEKTITLMDYRLNTLSRYKSDLESEVQRHH